MLQLKSPMDVLKILPKSNCRQCSQPTCLTFAVAVINGRKRLEDCPYLETGVAEQYQTPAQARASMETERREALEHMKQQVRTLDILSMADRLGARVIDGRLAVNCLGKDFVVDVSGEITSNCHMNPWVMGPLLSYIVSGSGRDVTGEWMPFRELDGGADWGRLFHQRCERPLKKAMDEFTNLFEYMIDVFNGVPAGGLFNSDIAVIIRPLPKLPILICYWKSEGDLEATLNMFFDATAEDNLPIESIYTLGVGLVTMFEKIAQTHGR